MRLDHLLSKEEEVGVVLLLICQGRIEKKQRGLFRKTLKAFLEWIREANTIFPVAYDAKRIARGKENKIFTFPVAMRLGDTPVLIPNTMVKT